MTKSTVTHRWAKPSSKTRAPSGAHSAATLAADQPQTPMSNKTKQPTVQDEDAWKRQRFHALLDPTVKRTVVYLAEKHGISHGRVVDEMTTFINGRRGLFDEFLTSRHPQPITEQ